MAEKGDVSVDTVSLPPTYAPSEAYTDSPPPAYRRAKSTTVQVARMVCITLLAAAFMIGFFTLTSNYLSARQCDCSEHKHHGGLHSASVLPQVEKLVGEEGLNKVEEMNGNGLDDISEEPSLSQDVFQVDMEEVAVPDVQEELADNIPEQEVEALVEEVSELEEAERELEEEIGVQDILQDQIEEMKKKVKLPIDLILGNPSLAGRDVNCEVERRQQPIGGGIVTQAIIVTCSDDDDEEIKGGPGLIMSPGPRRLGPPLSLLAPIMKMLSSKAKARANKPIQIKPMAGPPPPFPFSPESRPCPPNGPFPCIMNQGRSLGPFPGPFNGPNNAAPLGSINNPIPVNFNGPVPGPINGPFPGNNGPFPNPNGPFPTPNGPFPTSNSPFPTPNGPFPTPNGPFPTGNGPLPIRNGPFPTANGPLSGPLPGPNRDQISRHIHIPVNRPNQNDLPGPFQPPVPFFSNGPKPSEPTPFDEDDEPRNRMLPFALRPLVRLSPRMPRILALATRPDKQGPQTPISAFQRGANNVALREPKIISANPHPLPEAQGRALPSPVTLPGIRLLPARILSGPAFLRGLRREDEKPITHMEMRKIENEPKIPDFEPRFPDFGPPRIHTVISPKQPGNLNQFPPPPKMFDFPPSQIVSKVIEVNSRPINKDIMTSPKPIAVINKVEPIAGPQIPIFPPPPPPPPSSINLPPPPPPRMDPSGRSGIVPSLNPDAEIISHSDEHQQPPVDHESFSDPLPPTLFTKEEVPPPPPPQQPEEDRKHHLLIVN